MYVLISQSCLTLCGPMDCSPPGFSAHEILQARILEWVAISSSRGSSQPRDRIHLVHLLHWQADSLPLSHMGSPLLQWEWLKSKRPNEDSNPNTLTSHLKPCSVAPWCLSFHSGLWIVWISSFHIQFGTGRKVAINSVLNWEESWY